MEVGLWLPPVICRARTSFKVTTVKQTLKYREQTGGCQRGSGWGMGRISEGDKEVKTSSYKIVTDMKSTAVGIQSIPL